MNLEELEKTEIYGLELLDDDHVLDIKKVSENFKKLEKTLGNVAKVSDPEDTTFEGAIKKTSDHIDKLTSLESVNIESYDKTNDGEISIANYIKFLWKKLSTIELTDLKVKITTWKGDTLDKVLQKIKDWIGDVTKLKTTNKTNVVSSVNEVVDDTIKIKQAEILDRQDINKLNAELTGQVELIAENNMKFITLLGVDISEIQGGV